MKIISYLIVNAFIFCGCSSTYQINSSADAKSMLEGKQGTLHHFIDVDFQTEEIHIVGDSIRFIDRATQFPKVFALQDITTVKRLERLHEGGNGALIGASAAFLPLTIIALTNPVYNNPEEGNGSIVVYAGIGAGTLLGGLIGAWIGGNLAISETYYFTYDSVNVNSNRLQNLK